MKNSQWFVKGMKAGVPIALGYFAVAIALGISAVSAGIPAIAAALASLLNNASAGEYIALRSSRRKRLTPSSWRWKWSQTRAIC